MTRELYAAYILNLLGNSLLSFLTVWGIVELFLFCLRIEMPRVRALLRLLPIVKVAVDPFLYDFSSWALLQNINPLHCEKGTRFMSAEVQYPGIESWSWIPYWARVQLFTGDGATFTIPDLLFLSFGSCWLKAVVMMVFGIALARGVLFLARGRRSTFLLRAIVEESELCRRKVLNRVLSARLEKARARILQHDGAESPFCIGGKHPAIIFPKNLVNRLSQVEYEAVLSHELEHIRWKDGAVRQIVVALRIVLWWVPIKRLINAFNRSVEVACDRSVVKYGIDPLILGDALLKTARFRFKKSVEHSAYCYFSAELETQNLVRRVQQLAASSRKQRQRVLVVIQVLFMSLVSVILLSGRLWLF